MFRKLMSDRYGVDQLTVFLLAILLVLNLLIPIIENVLWIQTIVIILLIICYSRVFSKNQYKRAQENARFMRYYNWMKYRIIKINNSIKDHIKYRFYRCPNCNQKLRVPKGKGKITITCPKCKNRFDKKT